MDEGTADNLKDPSANKLQTDEEYLHDDAIAAGKGIKWECLSEICTLGLYWPIAASSTGAN